MSSRGLAIILTIAWLFAASVSRAESIADPDRVVELVYVETNIDASAGGHLALRILHQVYHYQAVGSRLLLVREPWSHFQSFYQQLENRGLRVATLDLDLAQQLAIESHLNEQLIVQRQHLQREQLLLLERDWHALAAGDGGDLSLAGLGYFLPRPAVALAPKQYSRDMSAQLGQVRSALAALERAPISPPLEVSRGTLPGWSSASLEQRENLLQLEAALTLIQYGTGLNPENLVYLEQARLTHGERQTLGQYQAALEADIERLLSSARQDRGYPLLISQARLLVVRQSLAQGHWIFLNSFPRIPDSMGAAPSPDRLQVWAQVTRQLEQAWQATRDRGADIKPLSERHYTRLETAASRLYESARNAMSSAVTAGWRPGVLLPRRAGPWWIESGSTELAAGKADEHASHYSDALESAYEYRLLSQNCVTVLIEALNQSAGAAQDVDPVFGDGLVAGRGLDFIPRVQFEQAITELNISALRYQPSRRDQTIAAMRDEQPAWQVDLRESNTLTSQAYSGSVNDDAFLFFSDGSPWLRPALGIANVTWAALNSGLGLFSAPFDGGERLSDGLRGMLYSAPELVFINLRKGQYDVLP